MQTRNINHFLIIFIWALLPIACQPNSRLESQLQEDIQDHVLHDFSLIQASFILSGVSEKDSLDHYMTWYANLVETIQDFHFDSFDRVGSANKVFSYLHGTWLVKYQLEATTLLDIIHHKTFNCVSATILYNLICEDLGWPTEAFETPTHVYTIFPNFTETLMVENTSPIGFDIMQNLKSYSRYLSQFYPDNQVLHIGLDRLYAYENSRGRRIDNTELLGLLAYNQSYFALKRAHYKRAYDLVLLAQLFNVDSRSNIQFEKGLYARWGKRLFEKKVYDQAFQVLADGVYRYPNEKMLITNCRIAFLNTMQMLWDKKAWIKCRTVIDDMLMLDILNPNNLHTLHRILNNWEVFFKHQKKHISAKDAAKYRSRISSFIDSPVPIESP